MFSVGVIARGRERANAAARLLLIDRDRHSQLPYMVATGSDRNHRDPIVHEVQDLVDQGLGDDLRVEDLAARVGLSPRSLGRRCQAALGTTPRAYIRRRRIEQATRELETTTTSVDMVRRLVGYHDATSFRRAFKAATGLSPTAYRSRYQWTAPS